MNNDQEKNPDLDNNQSVTMLKPCRHGDMLFLRRDQYVGRSLERYGEFSELEGELFGQLLRPGHVVVEVGANIGAHTVHLAKLVGAGGTVFAFEPQRVIFQILCANVALNALFNVHTYHAGLGSETGTLKVPPLIRLIEELGYSMYWHTPYLYNPDNHFGNHENIFPGIVSINLLCIPKELSLTMNGFRQVAGEGDWWQNAS